MTSAAGPRQVRVEGLAVNLRGPEDAEVVVSLVHGAMDRAASFGRVARRLVGDPDTDHDVRGQPGSGDRKPTRLLVMAHDRRGYADSLSAGVAGSIREHAEDLAAVLRLAGPRPVVVVGHSLGGTICIEAALHTLDGSNLASVGSYESPRPWVPGWYEGRREPGTDADRPDTLEVGRSQGPGAAAEYFFKSMVGPKVWSRIGDTARATRLAEGPALMAELAAVRSPDYSLDASALDVPIHCAYGLLSPQRMRRAAVDLAHEAGVEATVFENAGHGAHLSHPGQFARWILSMIRPT